MALNTSNASIIQVVTGTDVISDTNPMPVTIVSGGSSGSVSSSQLPAALGSTTSSASLSVTLATEDATTQTNISTNTAALVGLFPTALGRTAAANSLATVLSNEDKAVLDAMSAYLNSMANDTSSVPVLQDVSGLRSGTTALTVYRVPINATAAGDNTIATPNTGKTILVLGYNFKGAGAVNAIFKSDIGGTATAISGTYTISASGDGAVVPYSPVGWMECATGKVLNLNLSGAVTVGGTLIYTEV